MGSRHESEDDVMPPLEDDIPSGEYVVEQVEARDGLEEEEKATGREVEMNLGAKVDAMQVVPEVNLGYRDASQPIIQFPDDDANPADPMRADHVRVTMTPDMLARMQHLQEETASSSSGGRGPSSNDMIPAMRNLSHLQVFFLCRLVMSLCP
jgi:hypothetical protein